MAANYPPGIEVEILGQGVPTGDGHAAMLIRVIYAPGSSIPPHTDPGTGVWVVERGSIGFGVQEGDAEVVRAGHRTTLGPGSEVVLDPGDTASYGPHTVHTSRNAGSEPAVILIGGVYADTGSLVHPAAATPTAN